MILKFASNFMRETVSVVTEALINCALIANLITLQMTKEYNFSTLNEYPA